MLINAVCCVIGQVEEQNLFINRENLRSPWSKIFSAAFCFALFPHAVLCWVAPGCLTCFSQKQGKASETAQHVETEEAVVTEYGGGVWCPKNRYPWAI